MLGKVFWGVGMGGRVALLSTALNWKKGCRYLPKNDEIGDISMKLTSITSVVLCKKNYPEKTA
jgi:hypothetical protein